MSLVNVLERQKGWKAIARINHSEKLLQLPARAQKTPQEETKKGRSEWTWANFSVFAKEGTCAQQEEFIICGHSKYNLSLKRTLYSMGTEANQTATF